MDWDVIDRLHEKGYMCNLKSKGNSVALNEEGAKLSRQLFKKHIGSSSWPFTNKKGPC